MTSGTTSYNVTLLFLSDGPEYKQPKYRVREMAEKFSMKTFLVSEICGPLHPSESPKVKGFIESSYSYTIIKYQSTYKDFFLLFFFRLSA